MKRIWNWITKACKDARDCIEVHDRERERKIIEREEINEYCRTHEDWKVF